MLKPNRQPWNPEPRLADPLIGLLALLCLLLAWAVLAGRRPTPPPARAGLEGRLAELLPDLSGRRATPRPVPGWTWDQGVKAVLAAERGRPAPPEQGADPLFRRAWAAAYTLDAPLLDEVQAHAVGEALGNGYAARLLRARWQVRQGIDPGPLRTEARAWRFRRAGLLLGLSGLGGLAGLAGLGFAVFWLRLPSRPVPPGPSGRALAIVLLTWFLAYLLSGSVASLLAAWMPWLRPFGLPLAYLFHAGVGTLAAHGASGRSPRQALENLRPDRQALLPALGHVCMAVTFVGLLAILLAPLLPSRDLPQRELAEALTRAASPWALAASLAVLAVLAPVFEEFLFRGFLLPALAGRLGPAWALGISSVAFAAIHLQPRGLPTLLCLGAVLGLAALRTGRTASSVMVHAAWNSSVYLLMWSLAG